MPEVSQRIYQTKAKVIKNIEVIKNYYKILLYSPRIAKSALAGQFLQVRVADKDGPLLRRPLSIHRVDSRFVEIFYKVVGASTELLTQKKSGEYLDIIGPLGNGFSYRAQEHKSTRAPVLVAGGMGVAPLIFLSEKLAEIKNQKSKIKKLVLIGAKTKSELFCVEEFKKLGCEVKIATDDGSAGFKGKVTDLLEKFLPANPRTREPANSIYACGPRPMLKEVSRLSEKYRIPAQVSLEEHMACGIGACLGCVVKVKSQKEKVKSGFRYERVCKEGPVFEASQIIWGKE